MGVTGVQAGARAIIVLLGLSVLRLVMWFASERDSQGEIIAWSDLLFVGCLVPGEVLVVSSRRRHPRYCRDWSSDVCSSDLPVRAADRELVVDEAAVERAGLGQQVRPPVRVAQDRVDRPLDVAVGERRLGRLRRLLGLELLDLDRKSVV